ncbi:MAG TPA: NlpC/P60 family protein [Gaiellaceae bacterium]|nr:NlpC/P60 family protein [Gaiellaceae bacterium]
MRPSFLISAFLVALILGSFASATGAATSPLAAKREQAKQVIAQIDAIDEQLSVITERYDSANVALTTLRHRVTAERRSLAAAQTQYRLAQKQEARLLFALYTDPRPSELDVILGTTRLSDLLGVSQAETAISREETRIATAATVARRNVQIRLKAVEADRAATASTVHELGQERAQIGQGLARRRALLSSVQSQISQIEARQRARQERLAAEARARLAAQRALLLRRAAEQEAKARRAQAEKKQEEIAAQRAAAATTTTTTVATTTTSSAQTTTTPVTSVAGTTTDPANTTTPTTPTPEVLPGGHPEAATIGLQYIGVPYLWGGSTPSGFDCSGLVSYVFAQLGIQLPHSAADQYGYGVDVPRADLQPGDLVFFDDLNHVGIYIGNNEIVNAPDTGSFVRIDSLSEPWYATRYVGARRV